jgi:tetratricopeptide (TPR) repeat protein
MTNTRDGSGHPQENPSSSHSNSSSQQPSFRRSPRTWQYNPRRPGAFLFYAGATALSYIAYRSVRDWYYDFPIELGSPPASRHFVETKNFSALQRRLNRDYKENTNLFFVIGEQGVGKTLALAKSFSDPEPWFHRGWFYKGRPWLKVWFSVPHDKDFSESDQLIKDKLLELAKKLDEKTHAPINPEGWMETIQAFPLRLARTISPKFLQSHLTFNFEEENAEQMLANLKVYLENHPGWVIVADNVQRIGHLESFLPKKGGTLIITTNNKYIVPGQEDKIYFDLLDMEESLKVVDKTLIPQRENTKYDIEALVTTMGRSPLGIVQACGYLNETNSSIKKFLALLKENPKKILQYNSELTQSHPDLFRTLELTLSHLRNHKKKGGSVINSLSVSSYFSNAQTPEETLLSIMSLFAPHEIPESLLRQAFDNATRNTGDSFDSTIATLTNFNIIEHNETNVKLHTLKHLILQAILRSKTIDPPSFFSWDNISYYFRKNPTLLDGVMQSFTKANQGEFLTWLSHVMYLEELIKKASVKRYSENSHCEFLRFTEDYLNRLHKTLGYRQMRELSSQFNLPIPESQKKILEQQIVRLQKILQFQERTKGRDHIETAVTLNNLGNAYGALGDHSKERDFLERTLKIQEAHYGKDHIETAVTLNNLGSAYGALGDQGKKRDFLERTLKIQEAHYGKDHIETAGTLNNLGSAYGALGDQGKMRDFLERTLKIQEAHYGKDHIETAGTLNNLGSAYGALGDHSKERDFLERTLKIQEAHYGKDHIETARTLNNLGSAYGALGDHSKERDFLERTLKIQEAHYGKDHIETAGTLNNLGSAYGALGDQGKKRDFLERTLKIQEAHYGKDHIETAGTLNNLGSAYGALGDQGKMRDFLERTLKIQEAHYGKDHIETAGTLNNLGSAYGALGDHSKERDFLERTLKIQEAHYGKDHIETARTLHNLGSAYGALGDHSKERDFLERTLKIKEAHYGKDHIETAVTLHNLGNAYGALGDQGKMRDFLERTLKIFMDSPGYGVQHPYTKIVTRKLSSMPLVTQTPQTLFRARKKIETKTEKQDEHVLDKKEESPIQNGRS